jgi:hypothetical protein
MTIMDVLLSGPMISRIRRNHGLEHATMHVLSGMRIHTRLAGQSDREGFWMIGNISTEILEQAVKIALIRLQNGEKNLAVHPNCGTNFVTAGVLSGLAAWLVMAGSGKGLRNKLGLIPSVVSITTLALIVAQPVGMKLQAQVTTSGQPGTLQISKVVPVYKGMFTVHRILTND